MGFNFLVDGSNHLPAGSYDEHNVMGDHAYLANGFYLSTVNGATPQANELAGLTSDTPAPAVPINANTSGYAFSATRGEARQPGQRLLDASLQPLVLPAHADALPVGRHPPCEARHRK